MVINSYRAAAEENECILVPAGLAWKYALSADSNLALYGPDDFHPSLKGSVLAALVLYVRIRGMEVTMRNLSPFEGKITREDLNLLMEAANKACKN